jgi:hypothetical protein
VRADKERKQQEVGIIRSVELELEAKVDKLKAQRGEEAAKVKCADKEVAALVAKIKEFSGGGWRSGWSCVSGKAVMCSSIDISRRQCNRLSCGAVAVAAVCLGTCADYALCLTSHLGPHARCWTLLLDTLHMCQIIYSDDTPRAAKDVMHALKDEGRCARAAQRCIPQDYI